MANMNNDPSSSAATTGHPEDDTPICGEEFDHDEVTDYDGPDGYQWHCRRCGAEGWEDPEDGPANGRGSGDA